MYPKVSQRKISLIKIQNVFNVVCFLLEMNRGLLKSKMFTPSKNDIKILSCSDPTNKQNMPKQLPITRHPDQITMVLN